MATTRIIPIHIGKGRSVAKALHDVTDYMKNPLKTENGELVSSFMCAPETADTEFLLSKAQYLSLTGRDQGKKNVIAYHIRQSFKPGEITPEEANAIGYELAMRFTKGRHAFIVCTHTDRAHIHNHVAWNSTSLDCKSKWRDFFRSGRALRHLSDTLCVEHGLSVIEHPAQRRGSTMAPGWVTQGRFPTRTSCAPRLTPLLIGSLHPSKSFFLSFRQRATPSIPAVSTSRSSLPAKNNHRGWIPCGVTTLSKLFGNASPTGVLFPLAVEDRMR